MPHYSADSADDSIAAQAWAAASKLTNNTTILLALFEAGLVESNFHNNTSATDHDSLGYLQQRPSQGWKDPTNVSTATKSFIDKAKRVLGENPTYNAGQLAAAVQVPAAQYRGRYQEASAAAQRLLADASAGKLTVAATTTAAAGGTPTPAVSGDEASQSAQPGDSGTGGGGLLGGVADAIKGAAAPLLSIGKVGEQIFKFFLPSNLIRAAALIAGAFFIFFGVVLLAREVRNK